MPHRRACKTCGPSVSRCLVRPTKELPPHSVCCAGYSAYDLIGTLFKVTKYHQMDEALKLAFIKVGIKVLLFVGWLRVSRRSFCLQEIGFIHMRISDGMTTLLQLVALAAKLCKIKSS